MMLDRLDTHLAVHGLFVMGHAQEEAGTVVLIGAQGRAFWPIFTATPEYSDGLPDPLDRWSKRILNALAQDMSASAVFPSDGPPYPPIIAWAEQTGRFFKSPVGMLVHDVAGLMISIRGALVFPDRILPEAAPTESPCESCADRACVSACPVDALKGSHYDVPACKTYLATEAGQDCMQNGCAARRACPISASFGRQPEQSAFHMEAFL